MPRSTSSFEVTKFPIFKLQYENSPRRDTVEIPIFWAAL